MLTLNKKDGANYYLLEILAEKHRLAQASEVLASRRGEAIHLDWNALSGLGQEDAEFYDDWMEFRGMQMNLRELEQQIAEIRNGDFSFA